ncbi:CARDB domain-containing protein [Halopiger aswanensis]|uniref:CARDB protein n=1 Tax=Halopiger aswanensis TaxID=148449 RepID=A0A419WEM3_9EURY|nr:CARDB domain-containing protein [Halopiger aswanensis]RKD93929.1 CARDB protein [Halopiger aswanensis]
MRARVAVVFFVVLLVGSLSAPVLGLAAGGDSSGAVAEPTGTETASIGAASSSASSLSAASSASSATLHRTTTLRQLPDRPGTYEAEFSFRVPDAVTELNVLLTPDATVQSARGFEGGDEKGTVRWTEMTDEPTLRVTLPANRTAVGRSAVAATGPSGSTASATSNASPATAATSRDGYSFVETGDWGIVQVPGGFSYRYTAPVALEETVQVDGPGATGGDIAVFGPVTEYERAVDGGSGTIRLVVPDAADLQEEPEAIFDELEAARNGLDVGSASDELFFVAAPTDADWGPRGVQYGRADAWVAADAELSDPGSAWLHEYVHVRQGYTRSSVGTTSETAWLVEGQADYHAATLALEHGLIDYADVREFLADGERSPYDTDVLAEPDSWSDDRTPYVKGRLVYGELDRQLRLATDGDRTLADVFRRLNAREEPVTEDALLAALEDAGGEDVRAAAEKYTRTKAVPEMWDRDGHQQAFDQPVAEFEYGIDADGIRVAGEPWGAWRHGSGENGSFGSVDEQGGERTIAVPADESVRIPATIANTGDRNGTDDATLQVNGDVVDYQQQRLEAGAATTANLSWTPTKLGTYDVRVGAEKLTAVVVGDSSVRVTDLTLEPETAAPGDPIVASATVEATGDGPGATLLEFRTAEGKTTIPVAVAADETATVEHELRFESPARYEVAVGQQSATVTVENRSRPPADLEEVPGFGAPAGIAALVALLAVAHVLSLRSRRP